MNEKESEVSHGMVDIDLFDQTSLSDDMKHNPNSQSLTTCI